MMARSAGYAWSATSAAEPEHLAAEETVSVRIPDANASGIARVLEVSGGGKVSAAQILLEGGTLRGDGLVEITDTAGNQLYNVGVVAPGLAVRPAVPASGTVKAVSQGKMKPWMPMAVRCLFMVI